MFKEGAFFTMSVAFVKRQIKLAISLCYFLAQNILRFVLQLFARTPQRRLTILCYHNIADRERSKFARQMDVLRDTAHVVPADYQGKLPEDKISVAITFDDALASIIDNALPELSSRSFHSTIFVPVNWLGRQPGWAMEGIWLPQRDQMVMTKEQLAGLSSSLVAIGSHSLNHPYLSKIDGQSAREEIQGSRTALENLIDHQVRLFAFPYGDYDGSIIEHCKNAGYIVGFSDAPMQVDPVRSGFLRGRIHTDPSDGPLEFYLKINGAYAWMSDVIPSLKRS